MIPRLYAIGFIGSLEQIKGTVRNIHVINMVSEDSVEAANASVWCVRTGGIRPFLGARGRHQ